MCLYVFWPINTHLKSMKCVDCLMRNQLVNEQSTYELLEASFKNLGLLNGIPTILPPNYHFHVVTHKAKYWSYSTLYQFVLKIINFEMWFLFHIFHRAYKKLLAEWFGRFVIRKVFVNNGSYELENVDGSPYPDCVNHDKLKGF
jgi:hypothetical protein